MHLHRYFTDFETFKARFRRRKKQCAVLIKKHFHKGIINLKRFLHCIVASKVTAILPSEWNLSIDGVV